jgi:hypothetical protein
MVAVLIVTSILFTTLFSSLRRSATDQEASMNVPNGVVVTSFGILHLGGDLNISNSINRRGGVSQDVLDALPVKTYCQGSYPQQPFSAPNANDSTEENDSSRDDNDDEPPCCLICLVDYENGDEVRTLPCGHDFHKECVDSWLYNHSSCPACRSSIDRSVLLSADEGQHSHVATADDHTPWTSWSNLARALFSNRITPFRRIEEEVEESSTVSTSSPHPQTSTATSSGVVEDAGINSLHLQVIDGGMSSNINSRIDENNFHDESDINRASHNNATDWRLSSSSSARRLLLSTRHSRRGRRRRRALELVASYSTSSLIEEGDQAPNAIV